jgi:hypothetical protein
MMGDQINDWIESTGFNEILRLLEVPTETYNEHCFSKGLAVDDPDSEIDFLETISNRINKYFLEVVNPKTVSTAIAVAVDKICEICGNHFTDGAVAVAKDLKPKFTEGEAFTIGYGRCPGCEIMVKERVALVTVLPDGETKDPNKVWKQGEVERTGSIIWMKRDVFNKIFDVNNKDKDYDFMYIEQGIEDKIREIISIQPKGAEDGN